MRAVFRQIGADLRSRLGSALLILLTLTAAATLLVVGLVSLKAATNPYLQEKAIAKGADVWFWTGAGALGQTLYQEVSQMSGVKEVSPAFPLGTARLLVPGHVKNPYINLIAIPAGQLPMMRPIILSGRGLRATDRTGAVLDASIAAYYHIQVGDTVRFTTPQGTQALTVVGLDASPVTCLYPNCDAFLYMLPSTLKSLESQANPGVKGMDIFFGVRLNDPAAANTFLAKAQDRAPAGSLSYGNTWLNVQQFINGSQSLQNIFTLAFGVLAALTAITLSATILGGAVLVRRRETGILKALGFTRGQLLGVYVGQAAFLGVAGSLLGILLGYAVAGLEMRPLALTMGVPAVIGFDPGSAGVVLLVIVLVAILAALLVAWRTAAAPPGDALRQGFAPQGGGGFLWRTLVAVRLPPVFLLGLKDVFVRLGRSALAVAGLVVAVVALALSFGLNRGITAFTSDPLLQGINYSFGVEPGELSAQTATRLVAGQADITRSYTDTQVVASFPKQQVFLPIDTLGGDWTAFSFPLLSGRLPSNAGEIALAPAAESALGAHIGSVLTAKVNGVTVTLRVVGIYRSFSNFGSVGMADVSTMTGAIPDIQPDKILVDVARGTSVHSAVSRLQRAAGDRLGIDLPNLTLPPFVAQSLQMLKVMAAILALIAALGVVSGTVLTAREQVREIGIRKAIGMSAGQILTAAGVGAGFLGLIGGAIGAPLGSAVYQTPLSILAARFGAKGLGGPLPPGVVMALILFAVVIAALSAAPAAWYALQIKTSDALRAE